MRRLVAGLLWFYATWYMIAFVAMVLGVTDAVGPIAGAAVGLLIALDPRRVLWARPASLTDGDPAVLA